MIGIIDQASARVTPENDSNESVTIVSIAVLTPSGGCDLYVVSSFRRFSTKAQSAKGPSN